MTALEQMVAKLQDHQAGHRYAKRTRAEMLRHKQQLIDLNPGLDLDLSHFDEIVAKLDAEIAEHLSIFNMNKEAIVTLVGMLRITS